MKVLFGYHEIVNAIESYYLMGGTIFSLFSLLSYSFYIKVVFDTNKLTCLLSLLQ